MPRVDPSSSPPPRGSHKVPASHLHTFDSSFMERSKAILVEESRVLILEGLQFDTLDFLSDESLDRIDVGGIGSGDQSECISLGLCAARSPDSMDIVLWVSGDIVINNVSYVSDI